MNTWKTIQKFLIKSLTIVVLIAGFTISFAGQYTAIAQANNPKADQYAAEGKAQYEIEEGYDQLHNPHSAMTEKSDYAEERVEAGAESSLMQNVREKLNLDEPLPEDTKKFFRQVQGKEPIENESRP